MPSEVSKPYFVRENLAMEVSVVDDRRNPQRDAVIVGVAGAEAALSLTRQATEFQREAVAELKRKAAEAIKRERELAAAKDKTADAKARDQNEGVPGDAEPEQRNVGLKGEKPEKTDVPEGTYLNIRA